MHSIVQKFGGTSSRSKETRAIMYDNCIREVKAGNKVVIVVSAMGRFDDPYATDTLLATVNTKNLTNQELFYLTSIGETLATLVCKSELTALGYTVATCTNEELNIHPTTIEEFPTINGNIIKDKLKDADIVICPGYQGSYPQDKRRGSSDLLAVAIGISINAFEVELYSDSKGIYTCDPRIVDQAKKLSHISYIEMLELSRSGAKILNHRCVQLAAMHNMTLHVRSAFDKSKGTYVIGDEQIMEEKTFVVSGITGSQKEARITLVNVTSANNSVGQLFKKIATAGINVHVFNQVLVGGGNMDISFIIDDQDVTTVVDIINDMKKVLNPYRMIVRTNIGKVSVIGSGIKNNHGMFQQVYNTLMEKDIHVEMTSSSEINISCYINRNKVNDAKTVLHNIFFETRGERNEKV